MHEVKGGGIKKNYIENQVVINCWCISVKILIFGWIGGENTLKKIRLFC